MERDSLPDEGGIRTGRKEWEAMPGTMAQPLGPSDQQKCVESGRGGDHFRSPQIARQ